MDVVLLLGSTAAAATMVAFWATAMIRLRSAAIAANLLFIGYGALGELWPVLILHLTLLPLNVHRFAALKRQNVGSSRTTSPQQIQQTVPDHRTEFTSTRATTPTDVLTSAFQYRARDILRLSS